MECSSLLAVVYGTFVELIFSFNPRTLFFFSPFFDPKKSPPPLYFFLFVPALLVIKLRSFLVVPEADPFFYDAKCAVACSFQTIIIILIILN